MTARLVVIVAFAAALPAQEATNAVEGSVLDAVSQAPVPEVAVSLFGRGGSRQTKTALDGTFEFEKLPPGDYVVEMKKLGYVGSDYAGGKIEHVSLVRGAAPERLNLELTPTATIEGRILDEEERPLKGVRLYARRKLRFAPSIPAESDEEGRYRLKYLAPGDYEIAVRVPYANRRETVKRDPETGATYGYVNSQYYPGVDDARMAGVVSAGPGMRLGGFDIRLRRTRLVELKGRVLDRVTGEALRGGEVELSPESQGLTDETYERRRVRSDGAFRFDLLQPGRYSLLIYGTAKRTPCRTPCRRTLAGPRIYRFL